MCSLKDTYSAYYQLYLYVDNDMDLLLTDNYKQLYVY